MAIKRTAEQEAAVTDRGGELLISAAAGSGKTRVLVERLLSYVEQGENLDAFLIITFTRAAAEELRGRIADSLSGLLAERPQDLHLQRQRLLLYRTDISTIHGFCSKLLREWGHTLALPPDFSVCQEEESRLLMEAALADVLEARYAQITEDAPFAQLVDLLAAGRDDRRLAEIVLDIYTRIQSHPDPHAWLAEQKREMTLSGVTDVGETRWGKLLLAQIARSAVYWAERLAEAAELASEDEVLSVYCDRLAESQADFLALAAATERGWDAVGESHIPFPRLPAAKNCDGALRARIQGIRNRAKKAFQKMERHFVVPSETLLEDQRWVCPAMQELCALVEDFSQAYQEIKRKKGLLDFSDLEHETLRLLVGEDGTPTDCARLVGANFREVMVDEYQDTNRVQNCIFDALSQGGRHLFQVGDVKQSIYRFRLAEPGIFLEKYARFSPAENANEGAARKITLSKNFRSREQVLAAVNDLFYAIMSPEFGEMAYTAAEVLVPGGSFPPGAGYETEYHILSGEKSDEDEENNYEKEARYTARRLAAMLKEGFAVTGKDGGLRPLQPSDVAILLRSPGATAGYYQAALDELGIPWHAESSGDLLAAGEVQTALALLQIIDNPHQDIPLLAVLSSPIYGLQPEELAEIRAGETGDFFDAIESKASRGHARCQEILDWLAPLRFGRGEMSSHALLWKLYGSTGLLELSAAAADGEVRRENLLAFYQLACRYENGGHKGLFSFLHYLERVRENGTVSSAPIGGEKSGVTLCSIHRSKGLEYPLVFVCALGKRFNEKDMRRPVLFHPALGLGVQGLDAARNIRFATISHNGVNQALRREMLAEEMRLLYVAMTRAVDKLILVHTQGRGTSTLKKMGEMLTLPLAPESLAECCCMGEWIFLHALTRPEGEVLRRETGTEDVGFLASAATSPWKIVYGETTETIEAAETTETTEAVGLPMLPQSGQAEEDWEALLQQLSFRYPYEGCEAIPAKLTASDLPDAVGQGPQRDEETQTEPGRAPRFRPAFAAAERGLSPAQRGTAVHTAMEQVRPEKAAVRSDVEEELRRLEAAGYLTAQEREAVPPAWIADFYSSPLGQAALHARQMHRETPFSFLVPAREFYPQAGAEDSLLLQGVVDLWFETDETLCIVDFKTDRHTAGGTEPPRESYRRQLSVYERAVKLWGVEKPCRRFLWFFTSGTAVEC